MKTHLLFSASVLVLFLTAPATPVRGQSTIHATDKFAWGANTGWINFRPDSPNPGDGVRVTDTCLGGFAWSANTGWINLGNGAPANAIRYANTDGTDSGVNHDGAGNLSGLAWSANLGWINFGWAATNDVNRPRINLQTGAFLGYAWSPAAGWINLGTDLLRTETLAITDSDGDGISDAWERERAGNLPTLTANGDADADGVPDKSEYIADTNPLLPGDGLHIVSASHDAGLDESVIEWTSRPTRVYRLWESTNLTANTWSLAGTMPGAPGGVTAAQAYATNPAAFYRIEAKLPLTP